MSLINRIFKRLYTLLRLLIKKVSLGNRLYLSSNFQLKNTSRVNIWGENGIIRVGDFFSMGYNSELYSWNEILTIGKNTSINDNCKIYGNVTIGSNCLLASNIFISSGSHTFSFDAILPIKEQDKFVSINKPILIEDDCWIGFGVVIMPGVYIGKGAIIGSNAVVTKNVFPYTIYGGVPAVEISKRLDFQNTFHYLRSENQNHWPYFYRGINYSQFSNLDSIKDGIEMEDVSLFLLKKDYSEDLVISGVSYQKLQVEFFLNNTVMKEISLDVGAFEKSIKLDDFQKSPSSEFLQLSDEIRERFNVLIVKVKNVGGRRVSSYLWKITSVGYREF